MRTVVIIPTIDGREESLARTVEAYKRTSPEAHLEIVHNKPTCGIAWQEGVDRVGKFDYLHFTADDLVPHQGWLEAAIDIVERGFIPSPWQMSSDGVVLGENGPTYALANMTVIPFCSWEQWQKITPMIPLHYYTDNYFCDRARAGGWPPMYHEEYKFTHYFAQKGRGAGMSEFDRMNYDYLRYTNNPHV